MATTRATREEWTARVARWTASGLSAPAFARQHGLNAHSLKWWKWRLSSPRPRAGKRTLARHVAAPISPLTFVEMTAAIDIDRLEVVLPSSIRIRVRPGFDAPTLGRVLDVLEARR